MDYLKLLNEEQRAAVECTEGPVMIIAGAGSGKTRVLTYRIAHLMNKGVDPFNILSLTFTNKAAKEMRARIEKVMGNEARNIWMGTFHSVFAKILRVEATKIGYPSNFTIYDTDDSKSLLKSIIRELNLDPEVYKPNIAYNRISSAKNNLISPEEYKNTPELISDDIAARRGELYRIYEAYAMRCFKSGAMDFDDLLYKTHELMLAYPDVLNKYQHRFRYILVDEYQDTNFAQYKVIKMLGAANRNVCVVGDDAQSIYAFRGANIQNILNFEKDYPELSTFRLEQNYRSTKTIVSAASSVIAKNIHQFEKNLWTGNQQGDRIRLISNISDNDEGRFVATEIAEKKMQNQLKNGDFAILYRTNAQSRSFEEALRRQNIPYRVYGGLSFYQRKEIKDMIAYLRLIVNHNDEEALKRVINYPTRGIGKTSLDKLFVLADQNNVPLWEVVSNVAAYNFGSGGNKIYEFSMLIQGFQALEKKMNAYDLAAHVAKHSGLYSMLYADKTVEGVSRYQNLEELLNAIKEFTENDEIIEGEDIDNDKSLGTFLQNVALLTDADNDKDPENADKTVLMTVHQAKGLEFKHVYIVGMEENLFPSQMALNSRTDLEEERRLFYVAITRAEENLTISYALTRFRHGSLFNCEPSRFIQEVDPATLEIIGARAPQHGGGFETDRGGWNQGWSGFGGGQAAAPRQASATAGFTGGAPNAATRTAAVRKPQPSPQAQQLAATRLTPEADFVPDNTVDLAVGMEIEHQRFGVGKVVSLEGTHPDTKATIFFQGLGQKQILLKFAKIKIIT
jgi:DNA helicase-2/ATP-dependent DNA helicase PcrA